MRHRLRLGDYRRVLLSALDLQATPVALVTITPPGDDALPPDAAAYSLWNRTAARKWKRLDARCKGRMRRAGQPTPVLLARVAQRQKRGLDHLHMVFRCDGLTDRRAIAIYVGHLKELHREYVFGFVDDPFKKRGDTGRTMVFEDAAIAGRYLTRYLTESPQLVSLLDARDASFRPLWVTPKLTMLSKVTMTRLRRVRHGYHVFGSLEQGSRPRLPVWWSDLSERIIIRSLLSPRVAAVP
jgi:hypothetical protein